MKSYIPESAHRVENKGSLLTGSQSAIFLRNKYQDLLERVYSQLCNHIEFMNGMNQKAQKPFHTAKAVEGNISAHESERKSLYAALDALLEKELGAEYTMWKDSRQGLRIDTKQGLGSGGGILSSGNISLRYLEQYPKLGSDPRFSGLFAKISEKEKAIRHQKEEYNEQARWYNHELTYFPKNIEIADNILVEYDRIFTEGKDKLANTRYTRSLLYRLSTEENKNKVSLQTNHHQIKVQQGLLESFRTTYGTNGTSQPLSYYKEVL
jgi:hypothetical protein